MASTGCIHFDHGTRLTWSATAERQKRHRELFHAQLGDEFLHAVRAATNGAWTLGDDKFMRQIAKALGPCVSPLPKGRPKNERDKRQLCLL